MRRRALGILFAIAPLTAQSDAKQIEAVVREFFAGVQQADAARAIAAWSRHSASFAEIAGLIPSTIEFTKRDPLRNVVVEDVVVRDQRATATVRFAGKFSPRDARFTDEKVTVWLCQFAKEKGGWKITDSTHPILTFVEALRVAPTKAARFAILRKNRAYVGQRLLRFLEVVGDSKLDSGELVDASAAFALATEVAEFVGDDRKRAETLFALGSVYWPSRADPRKAIALHSAALEIANKLGDDGLRANILNGLGGALGDLGHAAEGLARLRESLALTADHDPDRARATTLNLMGFVYTRIGQNDQALHWYQQSLAVARRMGSKQFESQALAHIAPALRARGDLGGSLAAALAGLKIARARNDHVVEAKLLHALALVYRATGQHEQAGRYYVQAIEGWRKAGLQRLVATGLTNLAELQEFAGLRAQSKATLQQAVELTERLPHEYMVRMQALLLLGQLHQRDGELDAAESLYVQSLNAARKRLYVAGQLTAKVALCQLMLERAQYDKALEGYRITLREAEQHNVRFAALTARYGIGKTLALRGKRGDLTEAVGVLRETIDALESTRDSLDDKELRAGFLDDWAFVGFDLADALRRMGLYTEAFAAAEATKGRSIAEILRSGHVHVQKAMSREERARETALKDKSVELAIRLERTFLTNERDALEEELKRVRQQVEDFRREMYSRRPELRVMRGHFVPASLERIQAELFTDHPGLRVVSIVMGKRRTLLLELSPGQADAEDSTKARLAIHTLKIHDAVLRQRAEQVWKLCATPGTNYEKASRELFDILLAPIVKQWKDVDHVVFVPDGALHLLPFGALIDGDGKHLIESFGVSSAPSITALVEMCRIGRTRAEQKRSGLTNLIALGNPKMPGGYAPLPHAAEEVRQISKRFGVTAVTGTAATEAKAREALQHARRVHFATHGVLDAASPMYSHLVFTKQGADDGLLRAREISELSIAADLVVLSACNTAQGRFLDGEGILGLSWSLFIAGAPSQIVSRWQAADEETRKLMVAFYDALHAATKHDPKETTATCLRIAQLEALQDPKRRHPYYWAPFCLIGDWR